jgi:hypothetical protein
MVSATSVPRRAIFSVFDLTAGSARWAWLIGVDHRSLAGIFLVVALHEVFPPCLTSFSTA